MGCGRQGFAREKESMLSEPTFAPASCLEAVFQTEAKESRVWAVSLGRTNTGESLGTRNLWGRVPERKES